MRQIISIHAPREGGDGKCRSYQPRRRRFQSTPPVRGATHSYSAWEKGCNISIHAPREGGDVRIVKEMREHDNFNPRPREGGDYNKWPPAIDRLGFQSTPPARGATIYRHHQYR